MQSRVAHLPVAASATAERAGLAGTEVRIARDFRARLLGLAGNGTEPTAGLGLLLPSTGSIHTFGMAFPLKLVWLDSSGSPIRIDTPVRPWRIRSCHAAAAVIELAADPGPNP